MPPTGPADRTPTARKPRRKAREKRKAKDGDDEARGGDFFEALKGMTPRNGVSCCQGNLFGGGVLGETSAAENGTGKWCQLFEGTSCQFLEATRFGGGGLKGKPKGNRSHFGRSPEKGHTQGWRGSCWQLGNASALTQETQGAQIQQLAFWKGSVCKSISFVEARGRGFTFPCRTPLQQEKPPGRKRIPSPKGMANSQETSWR